MNPIAPPDLLVTSVSDEVIFLSVYIEQTGFDHAQLPSADLLQLKYAEEDLWLEIDV